MKEVALLRPRCKDEATSVISIYEDFEADIEPSLRLSARADTLVVAVRGGDRL